MKNCKVVIPILFFILISQQIAFADDQPESTRTAFDWLQEVAEAPRHLNYHGTFVYYAKEHMETSRITHQVDHRGEYEKIETLDGMARIVFRHNDEMRCYIPAQKKIYTEKRWLRKFFPDLLSQLSKKVYDNYQVETKKQGRVAGYDTQFVKLMPKDNLRYGHKFWIDVDSGLLLKAATVDRDDVVEQFAFSQLEIGGEIDDDSLNSELMAAQNWKTVHLKTVVLDDGELGWGLKNIPSGFVKIAEMKRKLAGKSAMVDQIVLSDELASVSIFIEPIEQDGPVTKAGFYSSRGAINIYVRELDNNKITVVGEVPLNTIQMIGDAVLFQ